VSDADHEERLRTELADARAQAAALQREVEALRRSSSFRFGHAVATALQSVLRLRSARAVGTWLLAGRERRAKPPPQASGPRTVLFIAWGLDEAGVEHVARRIERLQAVLVWFEPVVVLDTPAVEPVRRRGLAFEHIESRGEWTRHRSAYEWSEYASARMAEIVREREPDVVVVLESPDRPGALEQGILDPLIIPAVAVSDDNLMPTPDTLGEPVGDATELLLRDALSGSPPHRPRPDEAARAPR
jgi:hypothetical protein